MDIVVIGVLAFQINDENGSENNQSELLKAESK